MGSSSSKPEAKEVQYTISQLNMANVYKKDTNYETFMTNGKNDITNIVVHGIIFFIVLFIMLLFRGKYIK